MCISMAASEALKKVIHFSIKVSMNKKCYYWEMRGPRPTIAQSIIGNYNVTREGPKGQQSFE